MIAQLIEGERILLRSLSRETIDEYCAMFSPRIMQALHVTDVACERAYLDQQLRFVQQQQEIFYCVYHRATMQLIGAIQIRPQQESRGQLYSWINEQFWGNNYYQEALSLACPVYFTTFDTFYFYAHIDVVNERSYRALRKFGCAHVGFIEGPRGRQHRLVVIKNN